MAQKISLFNIKNIKVEKYKQSLLFILKDTYNNETVINVFGNDLNL